MRKILLCLLFAPFVLIQNIKSQCPGALDCRAAPIACGPSFLNGMACTTLPFANPGRGQVNGCAGVVPSNIQWWSFVGDGTWVDITITIGNCPGATLGSPQGIEAGVIPYDCERTNWFFWTCNTDCTFPPTNTVTVGGPAIMCETYYLWIDGCPTDRGGFAICDFTITVASGTAGPVEIPTPLPPLTVTGNTCVCSEVEVCIPEEWGTCQPKFRWYVNDISTGGTDNCENVTISDTFPVVICVEAYTGNPNLLDVCSLEKQCTTLRPPPVDQHIGFGITNVCYEDQPFDWHGMTIFSSCITPPCSARVQMADGCCVDSIRQFNFLPERDLGERDTFFCFEGPVITTEDGRVWVSDVCEELITFPDPIYRCDTSYYLTINYFRYNFGWKLDCGGCAGELSLCPNVTFPDNCLGDRDLQISLDWYELTTGRSYGTTLGDECIYVKEPGMYCFEITAFVDGKACDQTWQECFEVTTDYVPDTPNLTGDTVICADPFGDYYIELPPDICDVFWSIQSGGGVIQSPNTLDSSHIVVDWTSRAGSFGTVCVRYTTDCGESKDSCIIVQFLEGPEPFSGNDTIFCQLSGSFNGMEDLGGTWRQVDGPGSATISNIQDINSNLNVPQIGTYTFVWEEENEDCTITDTVIISFSEPPTFGPLDTFCIRSTGRYHFDFDISGGQPPYQIVSGGGSITGNTYSSDSIVSNQSVIIQIEDAFGCVSSIEVVHDCECGNQVGELSADTLNLCGEDKLACINYDATQQVLTLEDTVMFVLYSNFGDLRGSQLIQQNQLCFSFDPSSMNFDQVYYLGVVVGTKDGGTLVDYDAGCVKILEGQPVVWREAPDPDAGADMQICASNINLDGLRSVNNSQYRWLNHPVANILDQNDLQSEVQIGNNFGSYQFILEERNGPCIAYDTVQITFNENPEGDPEEICVDLVNFRFIVKFLINKGLPPYTIISGGGTIDPTTGMYCSDTFPDLTTYTITIEDANGCQFSFTDQHKCDCGDSDAGTMGPDANLCLTECIKVYSNGSEKLDVDEEAFYILHEGSGSVIINEIGRQAYDHLASPPDTFEFCFDANTMVAGKTYYISRLTTELNTTDDPCARLSIGQAITWNAIPNTNAGPDQDICGLEGVLSATSSVGIGMWSVFSSPVGAIVNLSPLLATGAVTVDRYGEYIFIWQENNEGCIGIDTVVLIFHDSPQVDGIAFLCDDPPDRYQIIITVSGGEESSWNMTGTTTFTKNNQIYTSDWINSNDSISFCITDQWDCNPICIDTTYECDCISYAGEIMSEIKACLDECINVQHDNYTSDANDLVVFMLHDGDAVTIGPNILSCQSSNEFCFDATTMTANITYFITPVVGNNDMAGCVDLADRCANIGLGIPITWYEYPNAIAETGMLTFTCETDSIALDGTKSTGVGTLSYQWTALSGALCSGTTSSTTWACASGTYILTITDVISGCTSSDTIIIVPDIDLPFVDAGSNQHITCDNRTVTLDGSNSDSGPNIIITWCDPMGNPISNDATITVDKPGVYTIKVRNTLTDCADEKTVTVTADVKRPSAMLELIGELSCSDSIAILQESGSLTAGGIRSYQWFSNDGNIVGSNTGSDIDINEPGTYFLEIIDDQNGCRDTISITVFEGDNTFESLDLSSKSPTCVGGNDGLINVNGVTGGAGPFQYSLNGQGFSGNTTFTGLSAGDFLVTVMDDNGCEYDTLITLIDPNGIGIQAKDDLYVDEGEDVSFDTLILSVSGTTMADADSIVWYSDDTGQRIGDHTNAGITNIQQTETFRVVLYKDGCTTFDLITIFVTEVNIYIPNVLNSGSTLDENSKMYIYGSKGKIRDIVFLRIYDRWGELVYQSTDLGYDQQTGRSNDGWDGKFNGKNVIPGVYIYHLRVQLRSGKFRDESGDLTVI